MSNRQTPTGQWVVRRHRLAGMASSAGRYMWTGLLLYGNANAYMWFPTSDTVMHRDMHRDLMPMRVLPPRVEPRSAVGASTVNPRRLPQFADD